MTGYCDYILGFIPFTPLDIAGMLTVTGLQLATAAPMTADVAALLTGHTLFVNGPPSPSPSRLNEHAGPNAADTPSPSVLDTD